VKGLKHETHRATPHERGFIVVHRAEIMASMSTRPCPLVQTGQQVEQGRLADADSP